MSVKPMYLAIAIRTVDDEPHPSKVIVPAKTHVNTAHISHDNTNQYQITDPRQGILQPNTRNTIQSDFYWAGCVPSPKGAIEVYVTLPRNTTQLIATNDPQDGYTVYNATPVCDENSTPVNQSTLGVSPFEFFKN